MLVKYSLTHLTLNMASVCTYCDMRIMHPEYVGRPQRKLTVGEIFHGKS